MTYDSISAFFARGKAVLARGPVALIFLDDAVEVDSTVRHHLDAGFKHVAVFGDAHIPMDVPDDAPVSRIACDMTEDGMVEGVVNRAIAAAPGQWLYYCFNTEYLFFPFCENRSIAEMLAFHTEERRDAMLTYVVDLYAGDLDAHPNAVSLDDACLDKAGYYALARTDRTGAFKERQLDFYGGLRWRFEEHVPWTRRRIDRIGLFRAKPGLELQADHTFNDPEYNTYACPWHHNLTAAICSFRAAKALKRNPGSGYQINTFRWRNSTAFTWHSQQLLDLGLMEPGQWF